MMLWTYRLKLHFYEKYSVVNCVNVNKCHSSEPRNLANKCNPVFQQKSSNKSRQICNVQSNKSEELQVGLDQQKITQIIPQTTQLLLVTAALILFPSKLFFGRILIKHWILYILYFIFFFGGTVMRILKYGKLSARQKDQQVKSKVDRALFIMFVLMIPSLHWFAMYQSSIKNAVQISNLDFFGFVAMILAIIVNQFAANMLEKGYDRVVEPTTLVTWGIYSQCRHPIYLSYMLLFTGYCGVLNSYAVSGVILAICLTYYQRRTKLEDVLLRNKFGEQYDVYVNNVKKYIPFVYCTYSLKGDNEGIQIHKTPFQGSLQCAIQDSRFNLWNYIEDCQGPHDFG